MGHAVTVNGDRDHEMITDLLWPEIKDRTCVLVAFFITLQYNATKGDLVNLS